MQLRLILSAFLATIPIASGAQELRPLSEYQNLPEYRQDQAYPYVRCIGLFQGFFRYGGANVSDDDTARAQMGNEAMGLIAVLFRQQKHPDFGLEIISAQLGKEIEEVTQVYFNRMTQNYYLTGEAFGSDVVVTNDFETCGVIVQAAVTAVQNYSADE